jgi:hypothetical protein
LNLPPSTFLCPHSHNDGAVKQVADSIKRFGFGTPLLVRVFGNEVIAGHTRLKAAISLGMDTVPVRFMDLSEQDAHALALADNRLGEIADWDTDALRNIMQDFDKDLRVLTGFDVAELERLLQPPPAPFKDDDQNKPAKDEVKHEHQAKWQVRLGDTFRIGPGWLACGSSLDDGAVPSLLKRGGVSKVEMLLTDPPYGVDYNGSTRTVREKIKSDKTLNCYSFMQDMKWLDGPFYVWCALGEIARSGWEGFKDVRATIVWAKSTFSFQATAHYKAQTEDCIYGVHGESRWCGSGSESTLWECPKPSSNPLHPTQKPLELMERAIKNHTSKTVLDMFAGSGTTGVAALAHGRVPYLMELDPAFCAVILERMTTIGVDVKKASA